MVFELVYLIPFPDPESNSVPVEYEAAVTF